MFGDSAPVAVIALGLLLSACAAEGSTQLRPPARYDHPFAGEVRIIYHPSSDIRRQCGIERGAPVRGCAGVHDGVCVVQIARYAKISSRAILIRHEIAHCNGWSADHPR